MKHKTLYRIDKSNLYKQGEDVFISREDIGRLKEPHHILYFRKQSHYNIFHDTPALGCMEEALTASTITGPYTSRPKTKAPSESGFGETRECVMEKITPRNILHGDFQRVQKVACGTQTDDSLAQLVAYIDKIDGKKIAEIGVQAMATLRSRGLLREQKLPEGIFGEERVYHGVVDGCLVEATVSNSRDYVNHSGERISYPLIFIEAFGYENRPAKILQESGAFGLRDAFGWCGNLGTKHSIQNGLSYRFSMEKHDSIKTVIGKENIIL